jgi:plastocyanin
VNLPHLIGSVSLLSLAAMAVAETHDIGVGTTYFDPQFVMVQEGDVVNWNWEGGTHDVTSGEACENPDGVLDSGLINSANPQFSYTVPAASSDTVIEYYCSQSAHCVNGDQYAALIYGGGVLHQVSTNGFAFDPPNLTGVNAGDTVVWIHGGGTHTVTFGTDCTAEGGFSESLSSLNPLVFWMVPESAAGTTQDYFCVPHCGFGMSATIEIEAGAADCPGDTNGDLVINVDDLLELLSQFGEDCSGGCSADFDNDLDVDVDDLLALLSVFGQEC